MPRIRNKDIWSRPPSTTTSILASTTRGQMSYSHTKQPKKEREVTPNELKEKEYFQKIERNYQPRFVMALPLPLQEHFEDQDMEKYFQKCRDKLGMVPNVLRAYSHDFTRLKNFVNMYNDLMIGESSTLTKMEREMIAVAVSCVNRCFYCLVAHGAALRKLSGDPRLGELIAMNYRIAELSPRQRAMLDFATKLTEKPYEVGEQDRQALRKSFTEREIWDICEIAGFFNMSNRVASGVEMMPNELYHTLDRQLDPLPSQQKNG